MHVRPLRYIGDRHRDTRKRPDGVVPVGPNIADHVATPGVRSSCLLCMDTHRALFTSTVSRQDGIQSSLLYSQRNDPLPTFEGTKQPYTVGRDTLHRQRRAQLPNHREPYDVDGRPWGSLSLHPSKTELSISRESIASTIHDDPLEVLQHKNPSSPQNTGASGQSRPKRGGTRRMKNSQGSWSETPAHLHLRK
ncbi:hypothetical protein GN956_G4538 [Arapaima gigas]